MAYNTITFAHPETGETKKAPAGISWTVFFFGFFPPMFRGDWKWGAIIFLAGMVTMGLANLVFMFTYNKSYIKDLMEQGYVAQSTAKGSIGEVSEKLGFRLPQAATQQAPQAVGA